MKEHNFEQSGWTLEALLPAHEGAELERILGELEQQVAQFENSRESLSPEMGSEEFLDWTLDKLSLPSCLTAGRNGDKQPPISGP